MYFFPPSLYISAGIITNYINGYQVYFFYSTEKTVPNSRINAVTRHLFGSGFKEEMYASKWFSIWGMGD